MKNYTIIIFITMMLATSCTIKPPGVTITSEKTSLEKQLLGSFDRAENDPYTTAAVWIAQPTSFGTRDTLNIVRAVDPRIIKAQARRRLNAADIDSLKSQGAIGEGKDGLIHLMRTERVLTDSTYSKLANLMIKTENEDRQVILDQYFIARNITDDDLKTRLTGSFAEVMARRSPVGTPIQQPDDSWEIKAID